MADQTTSSTLGAFSDQLADVVASAGRWIVTVAARPRQTATGILWKTENEVIVMTADHVVEREDDIKVILPDGKEIKAQLIGRDPGTDLAALRLPADALGADAAAAEAGANLRPGNLVLAMGRPGKDGPRVSFGAVSAIEGPRRSWHGGEIEGVIFADVTLYPGFSGGPLVDLSGKLVGLNSSHLTRQNSSAIPLVTVERVAKTLLTHGRVRRGYLGIGTQQVPLPEALAQKAGLTQETALLVVNVEAGSPAEQGGLMLGDLVALVGDQPIIDVDSLRAQLTSDKLGQTLPVRIIRGGEAQNLTITLGERQ
jgi:S1-C subfamily serine protease